MRLQLNIPPLFADGRKPARICLALWLAYAALVAFGLWHHTIWADEADPWNVARDATASEFWHFFNHTGHPPLWYALLWPFAHFGAPPAMFKLIHGVIAVAAGWVLLFRSPFALWLCAMLLFSFCLGFQYSVVVRGYGLMTLLAFLLAWAYPARYTQPWRYGLLLALLFNTESFIIVPTALLAVEWTLQSLRLHGLKSWPHMGAIALAFAGAMLSLFSLLPDADMQGYYENEMYFPGAFLNNLRAGLWSESFWQYPARLLPPLQQVPMQKEVLTGWALAFLAALALYVRNTRWLVFFAGWLGWCWGIFTYLYWGFYWHGQLILVQSLWTLWLRRYDRAKRSWEEKLDAFSEKLLVLLLMPMLAIGMLACGKAHYGNAAIPYSGSKGMAEYIASKGLAGKRITAAACYEAVSVAHYLPHTEFWHPGQEGRVSSFNAWGAVQRCMRNDNAYTPEMNARNQEEELWVLSTRELKLPAGVTAKPIYFSQGQKERFYLYLVPKGQTPRR